MSLEARNRAVGEAILASLAALREWALRDLTERARAAVGHKATLNVAHRLTRYEEMAVLRRDEVDVVMALCRHKRAMSYLEDSRRERSRGWLPDVDVEHAIMLGPDRMAPYVATAAARQWKGASARRDLWTYLYMAMLAVAEHDGGPVDMATRTLSERYGGGASEATARRSLARLVDVHKLLAVHTEAEGVDARSFRVLSDAHENDAHTT